MHHLFGSIPQLKGLPKHALHTISHIAADEQSFTIVTNDDQVYDITKNPENDTYRLERVDAWCNKNVRFFRCTDGGLKVAICKDGRMFARGKNRHLVTGEQTQNYSPKEIKEAFAGGVYGRTFLSCKWKGVEDFCNGPFHRLLLTKGNEVYFWGVMFLDDDGPSMSIQTPSYVRDPSGIKYKFLKAQKIGVGNRCSFAITMDGRLCVWGSNANGQFGDCSLGATVIPIYVMLPGKPICTDFVCRKDSVIVQTIEGSVYYWKGIEYSDSIKRKRVLPTYMCKISATGSILINHGVCMAWDHRGVKCWGSRKGLSQHTASTYIGIDPPYGEWLSLRFLGSTGRGFDADSFKRLSGRQKQIMHQMANFFDVLFLFDEYCIGCK
jgi:hypothetical protein